MKTKLIVILFIMCMLLTGCNFESKISSEYKGDTATTSSISIKDGTLTPTSATIIISDTNYNDKYSMEFWIYKKDADKWNLIDPIQKKIEWETRLYFVDDNGNLELNQNWQDIYGELDKGKYKLVKYVTDSKNNNSCTISVDFNIE